MRIANLFKSFLVLLILAGCATTGNFKIPAGSEL